MLTAQPVPPPIGSGLMPVHDEETGNVSLLLQVTLDTDKAPALIFCQCVRFHVALVATLLVLLFFAHGPCLIGMEKEKKQDRPHRLLNDLPCSPKPQLSFVYLVAVNDLIWVSKSS